MKNIFKNKLFLILVFFIFLIFINSNVHAYNSNELTEEQLKTMVKLSYEKIRDLGYDPFKIDRYFFCEGRFYFLFEDSELTIADWGGHRDIRLGKCIAFDFDDIEVIGTTYDNTDYKYGNPWSCCYLGNVSFTSFTMENISSNVDFFHPTPLDLQEVMKREAKEKVIATTLVGLVGLLIPFLICLIGFWKAWRLLLRILQTS